MGLKDKEENKKYMNSYMKNRYRKRREKAVDLLGGKCAVCSSTEDLEFDHKDPSSKIASIAKLSSASEKKFFEEIEKCQLLCKECHLKKSKKEGSFKDTQKNKKCLVCNKLFKTRNSFNGHLNKCSNGPLAQRLEQLPFK